MKEVSMGGMKKEIRDLAATRITEGSFDQKNAVEYALALAMETTKDSSSASYLDEKMNKFMNSVCRKTEEQDMGGVPRFCKFKDEYEEDVWG